jgi:multiple sugar transport system substrate-binding protein
MLLLTACGGATDTPAASGSAPAQTEKSDAAENPAPESTGAEVTITVTDWNTGAASEAQKKAVQQYMDENPGIIIDHQTIVYDEYNTKLNTLIAADDCPDIYYMNDLQAVNFGEDGVAADLAALYGAQGIDVRDKFLSAGLYGTGDKVYGIAYGVVSMIMYYHKEIFDDAGIPYPSIDPDKPIAWDTWVEALKQLTVDVNGKHPGEDGFNAVATKTYGTLTPSWYYTLSALLYSNNARYFGPEGLTLGNPEGLEVLGAVADLANKHQVAPVPIAKDALPAVSQMFADKQLATYISGSYEYPDIAAAVPDIGIAPLPMFEKPATIAWAACNQISAKTENMDETFKFFRWYVEADTNNCHLVSNMPSEVKYYEDESLYDIWMDPSFYNEEYRSVVPTLMSKHSQIAETALVRNASQVFNEVIGPDLDFLWLGEKTPEEVVETMKTDLVDVFEGVW